jgi:hypothetical protein
MCITASFVNFIGSRASTAAAEHALSGYRSDGRMAGEGNPIDPAQARLQVSRHVKVVGLLLVQRGHVPTHMLSRTAPQVITPWNVAGTLVCRTT